MFVRSFVRLFVCLLYVSRSLVESTNVDWWRNTDSLVITLMIHPQCCDSQNFADAGYLFDFYCFYEVIDVLEVGGTNLLCCVCCCC